MSYYSGEEKRRELPLPLPTLRAIFFFDDLPSQGEKIGRVANAILYFEEIPGKMQERCSV
jgi:hypothetical protein